MIERYSNVSSLSRRKTLVGMLLGWVLLICLAYWLKFSWLFLLLRWKINLDVKNSKNASYENGTSDWTYGATNQKKLLKVFTMILRLVIVLISMINFGDSFLEISFRFDSFQVFFSCYWYFLWYTIIFAFFLNFTSRELRSCFYNFWYLHVASP